MKKLSLLLIIAVVMAACENTTKNFGQSFTPQNPVSINNVLQQLTTAKTINNVQIEGEIEKSCMGEGCWFTIKDSTGRAVTLDVKDKKFRVPTNSPGKTVIILADVLQDSTSEQKITLWVKGLMFK